MGSTGATDHDRPRADVIRVLHVDDEPALVELSSAFLERECERLGVSRATDVEAALAHLDEQPVDCVVSDYDMPGTDGLEFLDAVRADRPELPFILYTGKGSEEIASEAISAGVTDYIRKEAGTDQYAVLAHQIENAVDQFRSTRAVEATERTLLQLAERTDDLLFMFEGDWSELIFVNSASEELYGGSILELRDDPSAFAQHVYPADRDLAMDAVERLQDGEGIDIEYRIQPDGDEIRWVRNIAKPIFDDEGRLDRIAGIVRDVTERRRRENELAAQVAAVEEATDSIAIVDDDGTMLYKNPAIQRIMGYEPADLEGENVFEYIHPEDRERVRAAFADLVAGEPGETARIQYRMRHADGSWRWLESAATSRTDASLDGYVISSRDVTERKRREVDLEQYAAVVDNMAEAAFIVGEDRRLDYVNDRGLAPLSVELADVRGDKVDRLIDEIVSSEGGADRFRAALDRVFAAEDPTETTASVDVTLDLEGGSLVADFQVTVVTIDDERKAVVTGRDITERKRREAALTSLHEVTRPLLEQSDREAVAREAVEATPDVLDHPVSGVWLYDEGSDTLEPAALTDAGRELVEEAPAYHRGDGLSWQVYERGEPMVCDDLLDEPDRYNTDTRLRSEIILPLGEYGVLAIGHTEPDRFDDLDLALARMYANTVEAALDRAQREARLRKKHRELERQNERLDEFASIVSHDLRNPLSVAQGRVELVRDEIDDHHVEAITRAHDRMADLIEDILSLARGENDVVEETAPIHLGRLARRSWATVTTADATLEVETDRVLQADKSRLAQLLENLIGNAVEHGGDGVTLTVGELDDGFYVADDGVGIPPAEREQVFDVGYTGAGDGTGFGLRIVEQVAQAHDWSVSVTESAAGGARFAVTGVSWADESASERTDADPTVESETTD